MRSFVHWVDDYHNITYVAAGENIAVKDILTVMDQTEILLNSVDHTVHQIVDFSSVETLPQHLLAHLSTIARHSLFFHPNRGKIVLITNRYLFKHIAKVFSDVYHRLEIVSSVDEAYAVIQQTTSVR